MIGGRSVPQHIQQQVIRAYCERHGMKFLLSATEYVMEGSTMMLDAILQEDTDGIVMYSMFLMPKDKQKRLEAGKHKDIRFAAENCRYTPAMEETFDLMEICLDSGSPILTELAHLN